MQSDVSQYAALHTSLLTVWNEKVNRKKLDQLHSRLLSYYQQSSVDSTLSQDVFLIDLLLSTTPSHEHAIILSFFNIVSHLHLYFPSNASITLPFIVGQYLQWSYEQEEVVHDEQYSYVKRDVNVTFTGGFTVKIVAHWIVTQYDSIMRQVIDEYDMMWQLVPCINLHHVLQEHSHLNAFMFVGGNSSCNIIVHPSQLLPEIDAGQNEMTFAENLRSTRVNLSLNLMVCRDNIQ
jgi:hypothetical protein